jgi:chromosome segregation ATPase
MYWELNEKIRKAKEEIKEKEHIERKLKSAEELLAEYESELKDIKARLHKEEMDIKKFEGITLSNFLALLLRNKEEKLDKERQEYIKAKIEFDQCEQKMKAALDDVNLLRKKLNSVRDADIKYKRLIEEKESDIKKFGSAVTKERLKSMENNRLSIAMDIKELKEAVFAGERLLGAIDSANESISSAMNWGKADIFMDSMVISMAKHKKIEDAQDKLNNISYLVDKFKKELSDVSIVSSEISQTITFSSFTKTFDIFFDNIFTDIAVQSKIEDSYYKLKNLNSEVENCVNRLKYKIEKDQYKLLELDMEINKLIEEEF